MSSELKPEQKKTIFEYFKRIEKQMLADHQVNVFLVFVFMIATSTVWMAKEKEITAFLISLIEKFQ